MSRRPAERYQDREERALLALAQKVIADPRASAEHLAGARLRLSRPPIESSALEARYSVPQLQVLRAYLRRDPIPCICTMVPTPPTGASDE